MWGGDNKNKGKTKNIVLWCWRMNWHRLKPGRSSDFMKNFSNLSCSTTLSVLSDYLSVALALFLRQYTLWWRYGVTLWLLWLGCRRCAFQPLDRLKIQLSLRGLEFSFFLWKPSAGSRCIFFLLLFFHLFIGTRLKGNFLLEVVNLSAKDNVQHKSLMTGDVGSVEGGLQKMSLSDCYSVGRTAEHSSLIQQSHGVHMACLSWAGSSR